MAIWSEFRMGQYRRWPSGRRTPLYVDMQMFLIEKQNLRRFGCQSSVIHVVKNDIFKMHHSQNDVWTSLHGIYCMFHTVCSKQKSLLLTQLVQTYWQETFILKNFVSCTWPKVVYDYHILSKLVFFEYPCPWRFPLKSNGTIWHKKYLKMPD